MATRIPLVPAAPADGKTYVQVNGQWTEPPKATTTGDGLFSKEDKAALDALVSAGGSPDDWISEIAGTSILLDADGSAILTPSNETIHFANIADETACRSITNPTYVHEIGVVEMSTNSWDTKSVIAGGVEWKLSAATAPASLMYRRYPNCNAPTNGAGTSWAETWTSQTATPTYDAGGDINFNILRGGDWIQTAVTMGGTSYRRNRFTIMSRGMTQAHRWVAEILSSGSGHLILHVEYFGPRYDYN